MVRLPPIVSPDVQSFIEDHKMELFRWIEAFGSPLYLLFPLEFAHNVALYRTALRQAGVEGRIWYAAKVNKAESFLETAAACGIGVDIASVQELQAALGHGVRGGDIGVSGPEKNSQLLLVAARHGCTISIDTVREVFRLAEIHRRAGLDKPIPVICRLCGFPVTSFGDVGPIPPTPENGRFGIPLDHVADVFDAFEHPEVRQRVELFGFGFHLDNHAIWDRGNAIATCLEWGLRARSRNHPFRLIDMGGGLPVQYVRHEDWYRFRQAYVASLSDEGPGLMFRRKDFGVRVRDGRENRGHFYAHDVEVFKDRFLEQVLEWKNADGVPIRNLLRKHGVELVLEPGRSLLDQAGVTVCRVKGMKYSSHGDPLLLCDMNISHMWDQVIGSEFAVDPLLLSTEGDASDAAAVGSVNTATDGGNPVDFHLVGNLCLESDVLAWRKVTFPRVPREGDLLLFINTAGYQMDFIESRIHRLPLPRRIAVYRRSDAWEWKADEEFSSLDLMP